MDIQNLRIRLTNFTERKLFIRENYKLLSLYEQGFDIYRIKDDIDTFFDFDEEKEKYSLLPELPNTKNNIKPIFCNILIPYEESQYKISELLCYIYAAINPTFDIVKGKHIIFSQSHFWLDNGSIVYSPGLGIITSKEKFESEFKPIKVIHNNEINYFLEKNNPLDKFYKNNDPNFSINYINDLRKEFNKNVEKSFEINDNLKKHARDDYFTPMRSVLTKKRKFLTKNNRILVHPDIPENFIKDVELKTKAITDTLGFSYKKGSDYNCYALSIILNLYDGNYKLHQGYYNFGKSSFEGVETPYQHSWVEKDGIVYDPAMRIITPSNLYYNFFTTKDVYTKEETTDMIHEVGYNLTFFSDYLNGNFPQDERVYYRKRCGTKTAYDEGDKLLQKIKQIKK